MGDIQQLDLKSIAVNSTKQVFQTMLSMPIDVAASASESTISGSRVVGSVGFAGDVMGSIYIHVPGSFAKEMAAAMLGMEPDEIEDDDEVNDVIGEVSNMIGGDLKSRLCDAGFPCQLSIPNITRGTDFQIDTIGWVRHERIGFKKDNQGIVVDVYVKSVA
uniref:Chemotaxis protein CheX n=1 Tax=Desulfatirhabdium butyrativorans TaxID=340467 RepID=A0A7C4MMW9_9BACT